MSNPGRNVITNPIPRYSGIRETKKRKEKKHYWLKEDKNTCLKICKTKDNYFYAEIIDRSGEILFKTQKDTFPKIKNTLKNSQIIPKKLNIQEGISYFSRLIWDNYSKNTVVIIKKSKRRLNSEKNNQRFSAKIITINGSILASFIAPSLEKIKENIKKSKLIPPFLQIEDKKTYFNRIKQKN
jgi:hypothetical protein